MVQYSSKVRYVTDIIFHWLQGGFVNTLGSDYHIHFSWIKTNKSIKHAYLLKLHDLMLAMIFTRRQ